MCQKSSRSFKPFGHNTPTLQTDGRISYGIGLDLTVGQKRVMTDLRQHFFSDTLSEDIVSASSLNNFKGKLQRLHNDGSSTGFFKSA